MAEHTTAHLWINTTIAVCAFLAAAGNALFNWMAYGLKSEMLFFSGNFSYDCNLQFAKDGSTGVLGLCWMVTVTNRIETRTAIVNHQAFFVLPRGLSFYSGFTEIEDDQGRPITFPIVLDGGDAKSYMMRVPVPVPESVVKIIESVPGLSSARSSRLIVLKNAASKENVDIVGNQVEVRGNIGNEVISWKPGFNTAVGRINFTTGRGNIFSATLRYPPGT
jgi:hypothetical protein